MNPEELDKLTNEELRVIALRGENLHRPYSASSIALRILDLRKNESTKGQTNGKADNQSEEGRTSQGNGYLRGQTHLNEETRES